MSNEEFTRRQKRLLRSIYLYDIKVANINDFWQPDQIEKWRIERYVYIKKLKKLEHDYPEFML